MYLPASQKLNTSFRSKLLLCLVTMHLLIWFWTLQDFLQIFLLALLKLIANHLLQFLLLDQQLVLLPLAVERSPSLGSP
jgi:hypothetical protein